MKYWDCRECGLRVLGHGWQVEGIDHGRRYWRHVCDACKQLPKWSACYLGTQSPEELTDEMTTLRQALQDDNRRN